MRAGAAVAAMAVALVGCSGGPASAPTASADAEFAELVGGALEDARAAGVDGSQIDALESARDAGVMSHEVALDVARDFFECLAAVGIVAEFDPDDGGAFAPITYRVYAHDPTVADACYTRTYEFVDTVYQLQPQAQASERSRLAAHRDELSACIEAAGIELPEHPSDDELTRALLALFYGYEVDDPDSDRPEGPVDCFGPSGLTPADA